MYILELTSKSFSDMEETRKEKLLGLLRGETGFLAVKNSKGRNTKVLTRLQLCRDLECLSDLHWDSVVGNVEDWSKYGGSFRTGNKVLQVVYSGGAVEDWWKGVSSDLEGKGFQTIEVLLENNFSNLRVAEQLCNLDKRIRLNGGVLLTLPSLNLRVGRKDSKGWSRLEKGVYDDLKPLNVNTVDLDTLVRSTVVLTEKKTKKGTRVKKIRMGIRSTGIIDF